MTDQTTTPPTCLGCVGCGGPDCIQRTTEPEALAAADMDLAEARAEVTALREGIGSLRADLAREQTAHEEHRQQLATALGHRPDAEWPALISTTQGCRASRERWKARAEAAGGQVRDYENRINWETTCGENARLLDALQAAEVKLDRVRRIGCRLAAHAAAFRDVLDEADHGPWARTVGADITELAATLDGGSEQATKPLDIRSAQKLAWDNKLAHGFNTTDVPLEFGLLTAEIGEAFTAWRKGLPDYGEELADVFLYLVAVAEMTGVDLGDAVVRKMEKNARRVYVRNEHGTFIRVGEQP